MQSVYYIAVFLFSGLTGWLAIWVMLKILFWPQKPVSALGFRFQGLLPKYQPILAQQLTEMAGNELFSFTSIKDRITDPSNLDKLKPEIEQHIDHFLREKLKESFPMIALLIGDKTINQLKTAFLIELEALFPVIVKSYLSNLESEIVPQKIIAEKINGFSFEKSGILLNKSVKSLFIRLQLLGLLIGLFLGLIQVILYMKLNQ